MGLGPNISKSELSTSSNNMSRFMKKISKKFNKLVGNKNYIQEQDEVTILYKNIKDFYIKKYENDEVGIKIEKIRLEVKIEKDVGIDVSLYNTVIISLTVGIMLAYFKDATDLIIAPLISLFSKMNFIKHFNRFFSSGRIEVLALLVWTIILFLVISIVFYIGKKRAQKNGMLIKICLNALQDIENDKSNKFDNSIKLMEKAIERADDVLISCAKNLEKVSKWT